MTRYHCGAVRHALSDRDRMSVAAALQSALARGKRDLADCYQQRLAPCPTARQEYQK